MVKTYTPPDSIFPVDNIKQPEGSVDRYRPLPTPSNIRSIHLFGLLLQSNITNELVPDETIQFYIDSAISEIEHELDLYITPVQFREKHDYNADHFLKNFAYIKLFHPNVISVQKVELSFSNDPETSGLVEFPLEYVMVKPQEGSLQLVPAFGTTLSGMAASVFTGAQFYALGNQNVTTLPGGYRITYIAGFEKDKVPAAIVDLIAVRASISMLSTLGPIFYPNSSVSISTDGLSQSTSTFGVKQFNDRLQQLREQEKKLLEAVKGYYQRRFLIDHI